MSSECSVSNELGVLCWFDCLSMSSLGGGLSI
jgi:hypothetical protein